MPPTPTPAVPPPVAAATIATIAAIAATIRARIFHHGSENGSSPWTPVNVGFGAQCSVMPVGTHGPVGVHRQRPSFSCVHAHVAAGVMALIFDTVSVPSGTLHVYVFVAELKRVCDTKICWIERRESKPSAFATKLTRCLPGVANWKLAFHITCTDAPAGIVANVNVRATGTMPGSPTLSRYSVTLCSADVDVFV